MRSRLLTPLLLVPTSLWYLLLLIGPLVVVVVYSVGERAPTGGYQAAFTFDRYLELPSRQAAFVNTLEMASLGTVLCLLVAYPFAYYIATRGGSRKTLLLALVVVPFWTSFLIRTYAWLTILGNKGIPAVAERLGLADDLVLLNTRFSVLLGIVYNYLPLMVLPIYVSLERLDKRLLEVSGDLGANAPRTFRQVTLPLSAAGVVTGCMLVFIFLMGEYLIPALLGGGKVFFLGNALADLFLQSLNWPLGSAVAVAVIALMLLTIGVYLRVTSRGRIEREVSLL